MVKIVNGEIVHDDVAPNSSPAPNPWASSAPAPRSAPGGGSWSAPGGTEITGMRLGPFPVMPQTALIIVGVAYVAMGWRGLVTAALLAGFNMIRTDPDEEPAARTAAGGGEAARRGHKLGQTIADFPDPPSS